MFIQILCGMEEAVFVSNDDIENSRSVQLWGYLKTREDSTYLMMFVFCGM